MSIWSTVDRLVDQATDEAGLVDHGLDLWAAFRWHATGRDVPSDFLLHERAAAMATLALPSQLAWIREVLEGPVILLKGPEVAARYPDPMLRPFGDLDLLVPDPDDAQRRLIAAGCVEASEAEPQHRPGLQCPGWLLQIEVHERPNAPRWTTIPVDDLFARAVPSALPAEGFLTVHPAHHAVLLAIHSWHHEPLRRVLDLVDIAAMSEGQDPEELRAIAEEWGVGRVWNMTQCAIEAVRSGEPPRARVGRRLGAHLWMLRQPTWLEVRIARLVAVFWAPLSLLGAREMVKSVFITSPATIVSFVLRHTVAPHVSRLRSRPTPKSTGRHGGWENPQHERLPR